MSKRVAVSGDGQTITGADPPFAIRKRGGQKLVPDTRLGEWAPRPRVDNAMVKALARAFRWRNMLDTGMHATPEDVARLCHVNPVAVCEMAR